MKYNNQMKKILSMHSKNAKNISLSMINDKRIIEPTFKLVYGCLIIDNDGTLSEDRVNIQRLLKIYGDKTGYEASCNEVRINDYINDANLQDYELVQLGLLVIESWKQILSQSINKQKCTYILSLSDGYVTIRTYIERNDEKSWLDDDLDKYNEAIAVI